MPTSQIDACRFQGECEFKRTVTIRRNVKQVCSFSGACNQKFTTYGYSKT